MAPKNETDSSVDGSTKQKIAILGGGWGSISTALFLTDPKNPKAKDYDVTVYQMGWRLGGKGASGRGPDGRIEEHGLHVWMGFYENSFMAIQPVYEEAQQYYKQIVPDYANCPFKSWDDAFKPHNYVVMAEHVQNQWKAWGIDFPTNDQLPGIDPSLGLSLEEYIKMLVQFLAKYFKKSGHAERETKDDDHDGIRGWLEEKLKHLEVAVETGLMSAGETILMAALAVVEKADSLDGQHGEGLLHAIEKFLEWIMAEIGEAIEKELEQDDELRRIATILVLGATSAAGMLRAGVITNPEGLDILDEFDFRDWLRANGAPEWAVMSAPVQALYDLVFGYENGEIAKANFGAGVSCRSMLRICLTYKGAVFWKMQAGMGDTVFAPPYVVLKGRGVKFEYFHQVNNLGVDPDTKTINSISMDVQATLKDGVDDYDPLVIVNNLPSWPAEPNYDQLNEGEALKKDKINLESYYNGWTAVGSKELKAGTDFDHVVLGISLGALEWICPELAANNPAFKSMIEQVQTVRTQAFQVWLDQDLKQLGWEDPSPIMDAYEEPMNTWADMSQLIDKETWPNDVVKNIAYFCGPMEGGLPPQGDTAAPEREKAKTKQTSLDYLQSFTGFMWPKAAPADNPNGLDFKHLVAPGANSDMERFDAQFFRANIDPTERYVLSVAGSLKFRLKADESGFSNLTLTGDWIRNGFNAGCIEATTWSGMEASNAVSGFPPLSDIVGLDA